MELFEISVPVGIFDNTSAVWHWALVYLQRGAGVAVGSSEARVTEAVLVQTVSMTSTVVFTSRSDVEVLHCPLCIWMPLIKAEAHGSVNDTRISITHLKIIENSLPYMCTCKIDFSKQKWRLDAFDFVSEIWPWSTKAVTRVHFWKLRFMHHLKAE